MKKTGLFKIIMFILLGMVAVTWIFSASYFQNGSLSELGMYNIGFFDFFSLLYGSIEFQYFIQIIILLLSIGALYGVLGKTGKYRAWVEKIANRTKGNQFIFLVITSFVIALLTAVFDYGFSLFIFFPLLISIILAMGYDRITAVLTTFGAMLVGTIGNIMGANISGVIADLLEAEVTAGIYYKIALFLGSFIVLMIFLSKAKKVGKIGNKEASEDEFIGEKSSNKYSITPIIIIFAALFVIMILGCTPWEKSFGVSIFTKIYDKIMGFSPKLPYLHITTSGIDAGIQETKIFSILFGNVPAFGEWYYAEMATVCLVSALLIGFIYKVENKFTAMAEGVKKIAFPSLMVLLAYCVIYFAGNQMFFPTISTLLLSITKKFSLIISTIVMILGSAVHVDVLYVSSYLVPQIAAKGVNTTLVALLTQSIYGVTMFAAPTSAILVFALTYLNIPYKEWIKRTWKLILALLAVSFVILLVARFL